MKKITLSILIILSSLAVNAQTNSTEKLTTLAYNLAASFDLVQLVIENNQSPECTRSIRGKISNNCKVANDILYYNNDAVLAKLGAKDLQELTNQITNYIKLTDKSEITPDEYMSAMLWIKASNSKVKQLMVKLTK